MTDPVPSPPRFRVLDVVEIGSDPRPSALGLSGQRGAVLSIRRYADGSFRYSIGSILDDHEQEDDEVPGIYDEEHLLPTGLRIDAERYGPLAPFRLRDVVVVSGHCDIEEARGMTGYVDTAYAATSGEQPIGVWVYGLDEACVIDARYLTRTGDRLPLRELPRAATSSLVTPQGELVGRSAYVVIDDVEQYL